MTVERRMLPKTSRQRRELPCLALSRQLVLAVSLALGAVGCGADAKDTEPVSGAGPLYAIMYEVFDDVGSTSYLSFLESLDVEAIDSTQAREYAGGRAFLHTYDGAIFV